MRSIDGKTCIRSHRQLHTVHRMGVINRDIKLENILLVNYEGRPFLKMCDFGYSINQNHSMPETAVGTPGYTGKPHHPYQCNPSGTKPPRLLVKNCMHLVASLAKAKLVT